MDSFHFPQPHRMGWCEPYASYSENHTLFTNGRWADSAGCAGLLSASVMHIPSAFCCVSAAPGTDFPVCFGPGSLCCVHFATGLFLFGSVPVSFGEALISFAPCDVHPAGHRVVVQT